MSLGRHGLNLSLNSFGIYTIQQTQNIMLIMNARTQVSTKLVEATGRPLKLHNNVSLVVHDVHSNNFISKKIIVLLILRKE